MDIKDELIELERGFWDAPGDGSVYRENMAADGFVVMPSPAGKMDREETIQVVDDSPPWVSYSFFEVECHELGPDVRVLSYRAQAERPEMPGKYEVLISSTYTRDNDTWKLSMHQQTPIGAAG